MLFKFPYKQIAGLCLNSFFLSFLHPNKLISSTIMGFSSLIGIGIGIGIGGGVVTPHHQLLLPKSNGLSGLFDHRNHRIISLIRRGVVISSSLFRPKLVPVPEEERRWPRRRLRSMTTNSNPFPSPSPAGGFPITTATATAADDEFSERTSPDEVRQEIQRCYQLIHKLGRGAIYLGSSRVNPQHPHYLQAQELAREIAKLLDCTTWTGAGPGLMDAAVKGAFEVNKPVGGFKISRESGEWTTSNFHPYLPPETYITCRFFSARKHALVDAAVRNDPLDMTAVVALPGGIGTLDEVFEILALIQLERIGSKLPVPFLLMNYDSYYSKLLDFIRECEMWGTVARGEVESLWKVCDGNFEALEYLSEFYNLPQCKRNYDIGISKGQEIVS